jgi:hypothetical protein
VLLTVIVVEPAALNDGGLKVAVVFGGRPLTANETDLEKPGLVVIVTV